MVRKRWKYGALALLGISLLALAWLLTTSSGAGFLLSAASRLGGAKFSVRSIEGNLAGRLVLQRVRIAWPDGEASLEQVRFAWQPRHLLQGELKVKELALRGGEVRLAAAKEAAEPSEPELAFPPPERIPPFPVTVEKLLLEDLLLQRAGETPLVIEKMAAQLAWDRPVVRLDDFELRLPEMRISGRGRADLAAPALDLEIVAALPKAQGGPETISARLSLQPAAGERHLSGPLSVQAAGGKVGNLTGSGTIDWFGERLVLDSLHIRRADTAGELRGRLELTGPARFQVFVQGEKIDLQAWTGTATALSGELQAAGTPEAFQGEFTLANRADDWRAFRISGPFSGSRESIALPELVGTWLAGSLRGEIEAAWGDMPQVDLRLRGDRLDPAIITRDWPGRIQFILNASAVFPEGGPRQVEINAELLDSRLRGHPLTGIIRASLGGEELQIDRLRLRGEGFDIFARGNLQERVEFRVEVASLGALIPEARGRIQGEGWGRWRGGHLSGKLDAEGSDLAWAELQLRRATVEAEHLGVGRPLRLAASLRDFSHPALQLARGSVQLEGALERHTARLNAAGPDLQLRAAAEGGYAAGAWSGTLASFSVDEERLGRWHLEGPTEVRIAADAFRIDPFYLVGSAGGRLQGEADLGWQPLRGQAQADWERVDLALANPWLEGLALVGTSSGAADLRWQDDGSFELFARAEASGSVAAGGERFGVRRLAAEAVWAAGGLQGTVDLALAEGGALAGTISSPEPPRPGLPASGQAILRWDAFNLSLLSPWLPQAAVSGTSSGRFQGSWEDAGETLSATGKVEAAGGVRYGDLALRIRHAAADLDWTADGLRAAWEVQAGERGELRGTVSSTEPARLAPPRHGKLAAQWQGIDLALLRPWLPSQVLLEGGLGGRLAGEWRDGGEIDIGGTLAVAGGELQWGGEEGVITASLRQAELGWHWRQEALTGEISLLLADYGRAEGTFSLPLPAHLPTGFEPAGAVRGQLQGSLREAGLLTSLLPGLVQETSGRIAFDLSLGGSWQAPDLGGEVRLSEAGAYLPAAGIRLEKVAVVARLAGDEVRIDSFRVGSGEGVIEGSAFVRLAGWQVQAYGATMRGKRFELIDLPEMQLLVSPDLTIEGDRQQLKVRGEVLIPELLVRGRGAEKPIEPSPDVIIVDAPAPKKRGELSFALDIRVRIILGDHVLVDAEGLDARLEGSVRLTILGLAPEAITAQGEIRVAEGHYSTYGVRLRIVRGNLLFAGGPVDRPTLNILALRTAGEVKAGVRVGGTPRQPEVTLYSEPSMPDTDILSYIVLGHPLGQGEGDSGLLLSAAGALLSKGESAVLQDRLKRQLGLDVLELQAGEGDVTGSMITIGKYLNPDLYISFGQSLFTDSSTVRLRYNLSEKWQLESSVGDEGAVDLYYKIEFR